MPTIRIRYQELIGKMVLTSNGRNAGRVADLSAEDDHGVLKITALLVGPAALIRRIAFKKAAIVGLAPRRKIPWTLVAAIDKQVHLRLTWADLEAAATPLPEEATETAAPEKLHL